MQKSTIVMLLVFLTVLMPVTIAAPEQKSQDTYNFVEVREVTENVIKSIYDNSINVINFARYPAGSDFEGAFIVKGNHKLLEKIPQVNVIDYYQKEDFSKINPKVAEESEKEFDVSVLLFEGANHKQIVNYAKSLGLQVKEYPGINDFDAKGTSEALHQLAQYEGVQYIDVIEQMVPTNLYASQIHGGHYSQNVWNLYGNNQIVAITDSGLDVANPCTTEAQCDLQTGIHPDIVGRIVGVVDITACNPGCSTTTNDVYGHGTATAGRFAGNGIMNGTSPGTQSYQNGQAGIAPESKMYIQDVATDGNNPNYVPPSSTTAVSIQYTPARNAGAHTH